METKCFCPVKITRPGLDFRPEVYPSNMERALCYCDTMSSVGSLLLQNDFEFSVEKFVLESPEL